MANKIVTRMKLTRETKGTYVYSNDADDAPIPTLYIKKGAFEGEAPKKVRIVIAEKDDG